MLKTAQQMPPLTSFDPMGGMPGANPGVLDPMAGGMGAMGFAAGGPPPEEREYKGLKTPEDIFKDYDVAEAFENEKDTSTIVEDIWDLYGGNETGTDAVPGRVGTWPDKAVENVDKNKMDELFDSTDESRWERLKEGLSIIDIFEMGQGDITDKISGYTTSLGLTKPKTPPTASVRSWYRTANESRKIN